MAYLQVAVVVALVLKSSLADVYLQCPCGSNNRLNENGRERQQPNRVFDSQISMDTMQRMMDIRNECSVSFRQNNNRGGCNKPDSGNTAANNAAQQFEPTYYMGQTLPVKFVAQHGMSNPNVRSNVVLQMRCQPKGTTGRETQLRDGTTTQRQQFQNNGDCTQALQRNRALHEPCQEYQTCRRTERNKGLFTANQLPANNGGRQTCEHTRQNNNGNRNGLECPEERDYWPYWRPSDWGDLHVWVDDAATCPELVAQSFNHNSKCCCEMEVTGNTRIPITEQGCTNAGGQWKCVFHRLGAVPAGAAANTEQAQYIKTNEFAYDPEAELGSCSTSARATFITWPAPTCEQFPSTSRENHNGADAEGHMPTMNVVFPTFDEAQRCVMRLRYNITNSETVALDSSENAEFNENNPEITYEGVTLQLAINTAQTGRTFEDRSHVFELLACPLGSSCENLIDLGVCGKRGNNQQVYPATEYSFSPNNLTVTTGDFMHIHWTGSNRNPNNNAGAGQPGTDRHNMVCLPECDSNVGESYRRSTCMTSMQCWDPTTGRRMRTGASARVLATGNSPPGNVNAWLNNAPASFQGLICRMTSPGKYCYMSTRNNDFSNRSQKGTITVE